MFPHIVFNLLDKKEINNCGVKMYTYFYGKRTVLLLKQESHI